MTSKFSVQSGCELELSLSFEQTFGAKGPDAQTACLAMSVKYTNFQQSQAVLAKGPRHRGCTWYHPSTSCASFCFQGTGTASVPLWSLLFLLPALCLRVGLFHAISKCESPKYWRKQYQQMCKEHKGGMWLQSKLARAEPIQHCLQQLQQFARTLKIDLAWCMMSLLQNMYDFDPLMSSRNPSCGTAPAVTPLMEVAGMRGSAGNLDGIDISGCTSIVAQSYVHVSLACRYGYHSCTLATRGTRDGYAWRCGTGYVDQNGHKTHSMSESVPGSFRFPAIVLVDWMLPVGCALRPASITSEPARCSRQGSLLVRNLIEE